MYEATGSRMRRDDYGYDPSNSRVRHDFRHQERSLSPSRRRNSRGRARSRSPREYSERIYDDFAARDYSDYYDGPVAGNDYRGERDNYYREVPRAPREYRENYEREPRDREDRDRRGVRYRDSRNDRSTSREVYRDNRVDNRSVSRDSRDNYRDNTRDNVRDNRDNRDSGTRDYRENRDYQDSDRDTIRENRNNRDKSNSRPRDYRERYHNDDSQVDRHRSVTKETEVSRDDIAKNDPITSPSCTVILQNIGSDCTEEKIEAKLKQYCLDFRSIVLIRDRDSGENKGFAFTEFYDINTAEKWMKLTDRVIEIDGKQILLNYSKSKKNESSSVPDWYCQKCGVLNFGSRKRHDKKVSCYQCGTFQIESELLVKDNQKDNGTLITNSNKDPSTGEVVIKVEPCNVLMVRGMDFSTTEEMIRTAIGARTTHPIYDVRLIRDKVTDMSRGFAFVEMGTVEHACELLDQLEKSDPPFQIAGRRITIGYARHGYNMPTANTTNKKSKTLKQMAAENALAQASSARSVADYSQGVVDAYGAILSANNITNATAVALSTANAGVAAAVASGIPTSYTYDPTSGYYYDSSTGLYYDPNTGYYYNGTTGKWLFWNGSRYQAVNEDGTPVTSTTEETTAQITAQATTTQVSAQASVQPTAQATTLVTTQVAAPATPISATTAAETVAMTAEAVIAAEPKKPTVEVSFQKPKTARKIAKDMERWAKNMNKATEARKVAVKAAQDELKLLAQKEEELRQQILQEVNVTSIVASQIAALPKDNIRSLFVPENEEEGSVLKLGSALSVPPSKKPTKTAKVIVADIPEDDDFIDESKFVDLSKMACLLCKRQFPNKDVLTKHLQISQLHKDNLEKHKMLKQAT